jgi:hypothetical protein
MKRLDRAVYAIFLLVLLADVARAHASAPTGSDAGLILSAASQLQAGSADGAILALRRPERSSSQIASFESFAQRFSGWSRNLSDVSNPVMGSGVASANSARAGLACLAQFQSAHPFQSILEHSGRPAP